MKNFLIGLLAVAIVGGLAIFSVKQLAVYVEIQDKQAGYCQVIDDELFAGGK